MFRLRELNMIDPNFRKQPPVAEGYSWSLPNPLITIWAEVVISFCGLYGVVSLKRSTVIWLWFSVVWGCLESRGRGLNWKKKWSLDPCRICSNEILDFSVLLDSRHEYLIFHLIMTKDLTKTGRGIRTESVYSKQKHYKCNQNLKHVTVFHQRDVD